MTTDSLITHCGARQVAREELDRIETPPPTDTWFPISHGSVCHTVERTLNAAGFRIRDARYALSRHDQRLFATLDLSTPLHDGVTLAVGIRNSSDKSFPLGFCAGSRVLVCDNLAFRADRLVCRKHTRFGRERFQEAICQAVQSLAQFREQEAARIARFQQLPLTDEAAESLILRGFEQGIVSHRYLPRLLQAWRQPERTDFQPRTLWSLFNAFTAVLASRQQTNPQQFAALTIRLSELLDHRAAEPPLALAT